MLDWDNIERRKKLFRDGSFFIGVIIVAIIVYIIVSIIINNKVHHIKTTTTSIIQTTKTSTHPSLDQEYLLSLTSAPTKPSLISAPTEPDHKKFNTSLIIGNDIIPFGGYMGEVLESCKCGIIGNKKIFEAPTYNYVTDGGSKLALNLCQSPLSVQCKCENMCICGEDGSCYHLNNTLLTKDQVVQVYFWSHCTKEGVCHMYAEFYSGVKIFFNENGAKPIKPKRFKEKLGPNSNYFKAISAGCNGCEVLRKANCDC